MEPFRYRPLEGTGADLIRLVELLPADDGGDIRCRLKHVSLSDSQRQEFEAMSYCWGDLTATERIHCDGGYLNIPRNLKSALRHLRHADGPRLLWADAISINQADLTERSIQVQRMRDIFHEAKRVLIWLGEADDDSAQSMALVKRLATADSNTENPMRSFTGAGILPLTHSAWGGLADLWRKPYFRRAWVVQEVAVSRDATVLCGSLSVSWEEFYEAMRFVFRSGLAILFNEQEIGDIEVIERARTDYRSSSRYPALSTLLRYRRWLASDPRDHIYAYYGLISDSLNRLGMEPNYHLPAKEVYVRFAVSSLTEDLNLDVLSVPDVHGSSQVPGLPSWVPDWSQPARCRSLLRLEIDNESAPFRASGDSKSSPLFESNHTRLGLEGTFVDTVTLTSPAIILPTRIMLSESTWDYFKREGRVVRDSERLLAEIERVTGARSKRKLANGRSRLDMHWETIRAGATPEGYEAARDSFYKWD